MYEKNYPLTKQYLYIAKQNENKIIQSLYQNKRETNTKSFDWYSWNIRYPSGMKKHLSSSSKIIDIYCPLLEIKSLRISYNLPRKLRYKGNIIKQSITQADRNVAKIPTLTGETSSSELKYKFHDSLVYAKNYLVKALRYLGRVILKKNLFNNNVLTWDCNDEIRNLNISKQAILFAKNFGILNETSDNIDFDLLSKLINIYFINEIIKEVK